MQRLVVQDWNPYAYSIAQTKYLNLNASLCKTKFDIDFDRLQWQEIDKSGKYYQEEVNMDSWIEI